MRDPNIRMFMENLCADSPMFDFVEESAGREVKIPTSSKPPNQSQEQDPRQKTKQLKIDQEIALQDYIRSFEGVFPEENQELIQSYENKSFRELMMIKLDKLDVSALNFNLDLRCLTHT